MSRWFRFYGEAMRNPKVIGLSDRDFRTWVGLLGIASENDGRIPPMEVAKTVLSMRLDHLLAACQRLVKAGLIDELADGYEPHSWAKFQYKSDSSKERVTAHRERKRALHETPPDTETEQSTEKKKEEDRGGYAFEGETIRLKQPDLDKWERMYASIPDLPAELSSIDAWFHDKADLQPKWFWRTQQMLAKRHQELKAASTNNGYGPGHSGIPI